MQLMNPDERCRRAFVFTLPPLVSAALHERGIGSPALDVGVQLAGPVVVQVLSTPLHLLGLNLYNVENASMRDRLRTLRGQIPSTFGARCVRIIPPFSLGAVTNTKLRAAGHAWVDRR